MAEELKIGSKVWCHDYRSNRQPWFEMEITGETRVSWLMGTYPHKVNKKTMLENQGAYGHRQWHSAESMLEYTWLSNHPRHIAALVASSKDVALLLRIATMVGYVVEAPSKDGTGGAR